MSVYYCTAREDNLDPVGLPERYDHGSCAVCGRDCWVDPASYRLAASFGTVRLLCARCSPHAGEGFE